MASRPSSSGGDGRSQAKTTGLLASRIASSRKRSVPGLPFPSTNRQFRPHCDQNLAFRKLFLRSDGSWQRADDRKGPLVAELDCTSVDNGKFVYKVAPFYRVNTFR